MSIRARWDLEFSEKRSGEASAGSRRNNEAREAPLTDVTKLTALQRPHDPRLCTGILNLPGSWHHPSQFWAQRWGRRGPSQQHISGGGQRDRAVLKQIHAVSGVGVLLLSAVGLPG